MSRMPRISGGVIVCRVVGLLFCLGGGVRGEGQPLSEAGKKGREVIARVVEEISKIQSGQVEFGGVTLSKSAFPEDGEGEDPVLHFASCRWGKFIFDEVRGGLYAETWVRRMNDAPLAEAKRLMTGDQYQNLRNLREPPEVAVTVFQKNLEYSARYWDQSLWSQRAVPAAPRSVPQLHLWPVEKRFRELLASPEPVDPRGCGLIDKLSLDFWEGLSSEPVKFYADHLNQLELQKVSEEGELKRVEMSDQWGTVTLTVDVAKGYRPVRLVRIPKPGGVSGNFVAQIESEMTWEKVNEVWVPKRFHRVAQIVGQKLPAQDLTVEFRWKDVNQKIDYDVFEFHALDVLEKGTTVIDRRETKPKMMGLWDGDGKLLPYPDEVGEEIRPKRFEVVPPLGGK